MGHDENCELLRDCEIDESFKENGDKTELEDEEMEDNRKVKKMTHSEELKNTEGILLQGARCICYEHFASLLST